MIEISQIEKEINETYADFTIVYDSVLTVCFTRGVKVFTVGDVKIVTHIDNVDKVVYWNEENQAKKTLIAIQLTCLNKELAEVAPKAIVFKT